MSVQCHSTLHIKAACGALFILISEKTVSIFMPEEFDMPEILDTGSIAYQLKRTYPTRKRKKKVKLRDAHKTLGSMKAKKGYRKST